MKRISAIILALLLVFMLAACTNSTQEDSGGASDLPAQSNITYDTSVLKMSFPAPDSYESVERYIERKTDGTLIEKNIKYAFANGSEITYAYMVSDTNILDKVNSLDPDIKAFNGKSFFILEQDGGYQAIAQEDKDIFGVQYKPAEGETREKLESILESVTFTDNTQTDFDDTDLYGIRYMVDESLPLFSYTTLVTEDPSGALLKKNVVWKYGRSESDLDFRFSIRLYKNSTIDKIISSDSEYKENALNGVTYTVLQNEDEDKMPYEWYTQHGADVYLIRNSGVNNGWFTERSEQSEAAFEDFLNTISFD